MKKTILAALLIFILAACVPAQPTTDVQRTAIAIVQTDIALTQTALPTTTATLTPTALFVLPTPSPTSTPWQYIFPTPNAIQVKKWKEYQTELANVLLPSLPPEKVLCEWEIIGQNENAIYIWAACDAIKRGSMVSRPALVNLNPDGTIQSVEVSDINSGGNEMFPEDIQVILNHYPYEEKIQLLIHLDYRQTYPQAPIPPLNIRAVDPTPSPIPVRPSFPIVTPNPTQLERWKEYQTKLAKAVYAEYYPSISSNNALCEWDILGQGEQKVYVFAVCYDDVTTFAVIYLDKNGAALKAEVPGNNENRDIDRLFPDEISRIFHFAHERMSILLAHLEFRQSHPEEPPLIILSVTPIPPTP